MGASIWYTFYGIMSQNICVLRSCFRLQEYCSLFYQLILIIYHFFGLLRCFKLSLTAISAPPIHPIWRDDAIVLTEVSYVMGVFRTKNIYDINKIRDHNYGKTKTQFSLQFFINIVGINKTNLHKCTIYKNAIKNTNWHLRPILVNRKIHYSCRQQIKTGTSSLAVALWPMPIRSRRANLFICLLLCNPIIMLLDNQIKDRI